MNPDSQEITNRSKTTTTTTTTITIHDYNYEEMLNVLKITTLNPQTLQIIETKCQRAKQKYSPSIHTFCRQIQKIMECIYGLYEEQIIISLQDTNTIDEYIDKIKNIPFFEQYDVKYLLQQHLGIITYKNDKQIQFLEERQLPPIPGHHVFLPKQNNEPVINTVIQNAAPGVLNSLKRVTQLQNINLNSCFRHNYYQSSSTDFQYLLPNEIKNVISLRLASIELPNAWYLFSHKQKNNQFIIEIQQNGCESEQYTIEIPDGNYNIDSLEEYLNSTYFCDSKEEKKNGLHFLRFSIQRHNMKSRFDIVERNMDDIGCLDEFHFSLYFIMDENHNQSIMNTMGWILGFRLGSYQCIVDSIQSEGLFDASGDRYVYMSLTDYQYNTHSTNMVGFDNNFMDEDILAKIPMVNGKLSVIIEDNNHPLTKKRVYNGPVHLRKLHIKLFDKFGILIDLNHMDFSFTLEMEILYESFHFTHVTS